jgi:hypothetical protein
MRHLLKRWSRKSASPGRLVAVNLLVGVVFSALVVLGIEVFHRIKAPYRTFGGASELTQFRDAPPEDTADFVLDPAFGFRPVLGDGPYSRFGTLANHYAEEKPPDVSRLLFVGDSVTHRAQIVNALRAEYGAEGFEYWNAGVESFNTVQEVDYYERFNQAIGPDHVIVTFHLNDFETTPVAFQGADGAFVVFAPNRPVQHLNQWLFQHSFTYRYWLGLVTPRRSERTEIIGEVRASLVELSRLVAADGARLTVLVLPILQAVADWRPEFREYRQMILDILGAERIRYFDLLAPLEEALAAGEDVIEPGDELFWHPSGEVAAYFARYLKAEGLLEPVDSGGAR